MKKRLCHTCKKLQPENPEGWVVDIVKTEMTESGPKVWVYDYCPTCRPDKVTQQVNVLGAPPDEARFCPPNCDHKWDKRCQLSCYEPDEGSLEDPKMVKRLEDLTEGMIKAAYDAGYLDKELN